MSEPQKFRLADGRVANVPAESVAEWSALMAEQGTEFSPYGESHTLPSAVPDEMTSATPVPAPAPEAPQAQQFSPVESAGYGAVEGTPLGTFADEVAGGAQRLAAWAHGGPIERRAGRGIGAPMDPRSEYEVGRDQWRGDRDTAQEENPRAYLAGLGGSALATVAAMPQAKAAQGATALQKLATVGKNIGIDAVAGGVGALGASEAELGSQEMLEDTVGGGAMGAGVSGALQGGGALLRAARHPVQTVHAGQEALARRTAPTAVGITTAGIPEDRRAFAELAASATPEGEAVRQSITRAERGTDDAVRSITGALSKASSGVDEILDAASVGMKKEPIARHITAEGIDPAAAKHAADGALVDAWEALENLRESARDRGKTALNKLMGAGKTPGRITDAEDAIRAIRGDEAKDAAGVFVVMDQLKRDVGKAVRTADRGMNADPNTAEELKKVYEGLRGHLEDADVWGKGSAQVQREVNAAWVPWIRKGRGLDKAALSEDRGLVAADPWGVLSEGDPKKVKSLLTEAGDVGNALQEDVVREALDAGAGISDALTKHYDLPLSVKARARDVSKASRTVREQLDQVIGDASNKRKLGEVATATAANPPGGTPLAFVPGVKAGAEAFRGAPAARVRKLARLEERAAARPQPGPDGPLKALAKSGKPRTAAAMTAGSMVPDDQTALRRLLEDDEEGERERP